MSLPQSLPAIKSSVTAAVLLLGIRLADQAQCPLPTDVASVLAMTGTSRTQAYQMLGRLPEHLSALKLSPGRPSAPPADDDVRVSLAGEVRDFLMLHPGAAAMRESRRHYTDAFRRFVVGLFTPGSPASSLNIEQASRAVGVPEGTLKDWLHPAAPTPIHPLSPDHPLSPGHPLSPEPSSQAIDQEPRAHIAQPQIATILAEYSRWHGDLSSFCEYLQSQLALPFGRGFITHVLIATGNYCPSSRKTPHQTPWSRGSMYQSFPGMQWFGDGKQLRLSLNHQSFLFNLEAFVDSYSNAVVAAHISDTVSFQPSTKPCTPPRDRSPWPSPWTTVLPTSLPRSSRPLAVPNCFMPPEDEDKPRLPSKEPSDYSSKPFPSLSPSTGTPTTTSH